MQRDSYIVIFLDTVFTVFVTIAIWELVHYIYRHLHWVW